METGLFINPCKHRSLLQGDARFRRMTLYENIVCRKIAPSAPRLSSWLPYTQMQTASVPEAEVVGASGCRITLADGRELIDGTRAWWSMCHGYQHPQIIEAITKQASAPSAMSCSAGWRTNPPTRSPRARKTAGMGMDRVFFAESVSRCGGRGCLKNGAAILA